MQDALIICLLIAGIGFFSYWVLVYAYGMYCVGKWVAKFRLAQNHLVGAGFWICMASAVVTIPAWLLIPDPIARICSVFGIWVLHAQPSLLGFWAGLEVQRRKNAELFRKRTDEWLREWEEPIPDWLKKQLE